MAETTKPSYAYTWASGGDRQTLTSTIITQGWVVGNPSFQRANAVESRQDLMLQHIDQHGIPVWSSDTEYFANKSYVTGSNGEIYRAVADSVGVNPVGDTSNKWYRILDDFFTKTQADARYLGLAVPSGAVFHFAMATAPAGYLVCNGAAVSRTAFASLFAAIGTLYGNGDGSTTFNLPDARGEYLRGADLGRGVDAGRAVGSWQDGGMPTHNHQWYTSVGASGGSRIDQTDSSGLGSAASYDIGGTQTNLTGGEMYGERYTAVQHVISGENRVRNLAFLVCIKV